MKKPGAFNYIYRSILISTLLLISSCANAQVDSSNLALTATVSTSYVSPWEVLSALNDGFDPASSSDYSHGAYGNWNYDPSFNTYNWIQYQWPLAHKLSSTSIYWWDDGGGIDQPTDAYIEYWNGTSWVFLDSIGTDLDVYNAKKLDIQSSRLRIFMKSLLATGVLEWRVYGIDNSPCESTAISAWYRVNQEDPAEGSAIVAVAGDSVLLQPAPDIEGIWTWTGPEGFKADSREITLRDLAWENSGTYTVCYINDCGAESRINYSLVVESEGPFTWPAYSPGLDYNFTDEYPALEEPANILDDCPEVVGTESSGWWTFRWGPTANPLVTSAAIGPMLDRMNTDFAYFRNVLGWPPDKRAKRGYKSSIYLYGSGLCTDNASNTDLGGWQSSINYNGESWPMVLISYYPVYSFDPSCTYGDRYNQMGAVVHEGIHSVLADLPGARNAAWFHEGGNTWLQQEADSRRSGNYSSMGFLNGASMIAPFMPIECYSGWLQDDSFGGPSAEGVNMFEDGTQICTWRNLLGGVQYSNLFPTFLGMTLGTGSIPWIWRYCPSRVLEGMSAGLGDSQTRRLIMEYRARQALVDMGKWTGAIKALLDAQFGTAIKAEWSPSWMNPPVWEATPYAKTSNNGSGLLTPEYRTTPGWSGANQVPLVTTGDMVRIDFQPLGQNMSCQLCYRTREGETVYSTPVYNGECSLRLDKVPANNVVFAVITNTDYIYEGEATRKAHFDYRLQLVEGVTGTADIHKGWYDWTKDIPHSVGISDMEGLTDMLIYPNPVERDGLLNLAFSTPPANPLDLSIINLQGQVIYMDKISGDLSIPGSILPGPGLYFARIKSDSGISISKIIVK